MRRILRMRNGTTLVEMLVTLTLISMLMAMAAATLASASKVFLRTQKLQYAQAVLDTTLTELRSQTLNATGYVKIYENSENIAENSGAGSGSVLEFRNEEDYTVLLAADGSREADIYVGGTKAGTEKDVPKGRLYARYYTHDNDGTYIYSNGTLPRVRAMAAIFPDKYYMGNYLKLIFSFPKDVSDEGTVTSVKVEASLYSDEELTDLVATDSEILDFRYQLTRKDAITASVAEQNP